MDVEFRFALLMRGKRELVVVVEQEVELHRGELPVALAPVPVGATEVSGKVAQVRCDPGHLRQPLTCSWPPW